MTTLYDALEKALQVATTTPGARPVPDCSRCLAFHRSRPEREIAKAEQIRVPIGDGSIVRIDHSVNCARCNDEVWSLAWLKREHAAYTAVDSTMLATRHAAFRARRAAGRAFYGALPTRLQHGALTAPAPKAAAAPERDWYEAGGDR